MRRTAWVVFVSVQIAIIATDGNVQSQGTCPHIPAGGGETVEGFFAKSDGSCTVPDGGYIKRTTGYPAVPQYRIDIHATTGGTCTKRAFDGTLGTCVNQNVSPNPENRGVFTMRADVMAGQSCTSPPCNISPVMYPVDASNQWTDQNQDVDSRVSGSVYNNSVPIWRPLQTGSTTLRFRNGIDQTVCSMTPTEKIDTWVVHVLDCKPEWFTGGTPTVNFHGPSTGEIKIVIPSAAFESARGPAEQAAADWATGLGRTVTVPSGYTTCTSTDPLCIQLKDDHGTLPEDPEGCASFGTATYNTTTGEWAGSTSVRFEPNWTGGHADNLRKTIAHELGHYFGLQNRMNASCTAANTIMGAGNCYGTQAPPTGTALGPTAQDVSPVVNSTYGNQVRSLCGW
jgi:hypothetical protein